MPSLYNSKYESWVHRVNPTAKLCLMLAGIIFMLTIHNVNVMFPLTLALVLFVLLGSGQPKRRVLLLMLPFLFVFVSTAATMIFFGKGSTTWWHWGLIHISRESFYRGLHIGLRALCFGLTGLLFVLTTRPVLLFYSLMQQLNLPPKYAYGFMASVRMLPLIIQEFKSLRKTHKVRGVQVSKSRSGLMQSIHYYAVPLLAQSIRRARRIAVAMESRRFDSQASRTYYYQSGFSQFDGLMTASWIIIFGGAWFAGWHYPLVAIKNVGF